MATPTPNYNLLKPANGETYNVQLLDDNYDKIDAGLTGLNTALHTIKQAEYTAAITGFPAGSGNWGPGLLSPDNARQWNNTFVQPGSNDTLKILENGAYIFIWEFAFQSAPNAVSGEIIIHNSTQNNRLFSGDYASCVSWGPIYMCAGVCNANDIVDFFTINRNTAINCTSRIRVTKIAG
jgi:hypothetical protein